jgi:hypothetical protein
MSKKNSVRTKTFTSEKIHFNREDLDSDYYRADLLLKGVDHRVPSYVGLIYINNADANYDTPTDLEHGYVGYYTVFGHETCLGDEGHCDELPERMRFEEIVQPVKKGDYYITITDSLKHLAKDTEDFSVTIVGDYSEPPQLGDEKHDLENIVKVDKVSIEIYDKEQD